MGLAHQFQLVSLVSSSYQRRGSPFLMFPCTRMFLQWIPRTRHLEVNMSEITKFDLWRNGILIDQNQAQKGALPHHIDGLRNALLDYGRDTPEHLEFQSTDDESRRLNDIAKALNVYESERASFNFRLTQLKDMKRKAEKLDEDGDCNWEPFFLKYFFDTLLYQTGKADEESDSIYYYTQYLKCSTSLSRLWSLFKQEGFRQEDRRALPLPKPDWVSSYTVYNIPKDSIQENLSYGKLQHLAQHGLESDASCALASEKRATYPDRDWVCFPWLIVQHGKPGGTETQCHHEAANASTAAVMMLERLCKPLPAGIQGKANEHVPPVVAITTVKKMARVWITYSCKPSVDDAAKFRMMCIWKGDMTAILDLIKFSAILCNAHKWALREQRPRISGFIDLWKARYPMGSRSTTKQEEPKTLPEPKTGTTIGTGSKPLPVDNMKSRERDRLLDLLEVYQGILKDDWQERQRLTAQVDEMRQRLWDLTERRGSRNPSSPPSQPVQQTGSPQSSLNGKSTAAKPTPTPPQPQFSTALNSSSKPNRLVLLPRRRPLATAKQKTKSPQVSSVRPEIFGKGIRVPWASHPGRNILVRLPKPPPMTSKTTTDRNPIYKLPMSALTQTVIPDTRFPVVGGQPHAPTKLDTPSKPATPGNPSGTAPGQDKEEAVLQTASMTNTTSNLQSAAGDADLFQTGSSTTSIFSTGDKPAVSQNLPKFSSAMPLTEPPSKGEQIAPASQILPNSSSATPLPKVDQSAPVSENLPKFNFAGPLPEVQQAAPKFDFVPLPAAKDRTLGFTSALSPSPPTEKDKAPASSSIFFSSSFMAKDDTHGSTASARFSIPSVTKEKDNKTAGSSSAPFSTSAKSNSKRTFRTGFKKSTTSQPSR
ncbi:hypothetical protein N657DRAFT_248054 [Parathielavia appendiculata]|uniref:Uncharacterized protein n=1 Tax=Parathielavia appendiculata TaxID=2587402 RepID=A0AAN6TS82_9PEZI|nr:hypothetical protein N657DRAFT_248054 [Parathielavia appendiculata]